MKSARTRRGQRGYILIVMACSALALLGAVGLAIDMGRLFIAKQETQVYVDAAALAAALELDGTADGIQRAASAVSSSRNSWNMNTAGIGGASVDFATTANGPWNPNPSPAAGYTHARVRLEVAASLFFLPAVTGVYSQTVSSQAVAAQVALSTLPAGLSPYTAVAQNSTGPGFGLVRGREYTIQWPQDKGLAEGGACRENGNPDKCFVRDPCEGDSAAVVWKVHTSWSTNMNGYWGFSSSSDIARSILDGKQTGPISLGQDLDSRGGGHVPGVELSNGNMAVQASILDQRAQQDDYNGSNDVESYLDHPDHNGRRLLAVPIVEVVSNTQTLVRGFGLFLLLSNGNSTNYYQREVNGNEPFCALYAGPWAVGSNDPGGGDSGSGAYHVTLVR
jgi:Flp pilus assembly protein TadG